MKRLAQSRFTGERGCNRIGILPGSWQTAGMLRISRFSRLVLWWRGEKGASA
jgi:hypothetical protein